VKVSLSLNQPKRTNNVNFEGYKPVKSDLGNREFEFNCVYDEDKQDCYLEIFLLDKDADGNWYVTGKKDAYGNIKPLENTQKSSEVMLKKGQATRINLAKEYGIRPDQPFAYHYKLLPTGQKNGIPTYKIDPGNIIYDKATSYREHEVYSYVTDRLSTATKSGAMKLIVPDFYNVGWVYDDNNKIVPNKNIEQARKTSKNIANKIGGSLAGIEKDLDDGNLDNYTRIITTPMFTDDSLSAHAYWNKNNFQMAQSLGNINNYASLQRKLFAKGINLVADGAYVNEGLEGVHFKHILQWGDKSPYFNWFKISGLQDSPLSLGVFGKNLDNVTHRLVNPKYNIKENPDGTVKISQNRDYDSKKPTYIQIYDERLVNAENLSNKQLIKAYDKLAKNDVAINNHNDTVIPYSFKINNETYIKNVQSLINYNRSLPRYNQIRLFSGEGTKIVSQFEYFGFDGKHESGFETWDANPDIAKLSFVQSHSETQALKNIKNSEKKAEMKKFLAEKNMEVQDYAISSAKFWSKKTNQILTLNVAQHLKNIDGKNSNEIYEMIKGLSDGKTFPKKLDINEKIVKNVIRSRYHLSQPKTDDNYKNAIMQGLMDLPLDSIEVGDDIVSVLASPYMTKRATKASQIGTSRYDEYKNGNKHLLPEYKRAYTMTDELYKKEMSVFASKVLDNVEKSLPQGKKFHDENGNTTEYGKYVLPLLTSEIAKYAIIKSVSPDAKMSYNKESGEIAYKYNELKNTSLIQMGIIADSPEDEAISLVRSLKHGINNIKDTSELEKALTLSISGTNANSFKLAEMIVNRAQAGLDWRIDATKDIADIESIRSKKTNFEYTWNQIINFWIKFSENVKQYHPDAYIAGEVTDENALFDTTGIHNARYSSPKEAVKKLVNEAGFTTTANYTYLSSSINQIFGKLFDFDGSNSPDKGCFQNGTVRNQLAEFLTSGPIESIIYSYTFMGNHDKCRAIDGYAMDMDMVYTDLTDKNNYDYRHRAYKILHAMPFGKEPNSDSVYGYDFSRVSSLAIARCESIASGMGKAIRKIGLDQGRVDYVYGLMLKSLANISNGKHLGRVIETEGFGTKDFPTALRVVLNEMEYIADNEGDGRLTETERKNLTKQTLEAILDPAMSKLLGQTKFITALTGNPTLYAGDDVGATGFEHTTKNITVQNRNIVHDEWIDRNSPEYMDFVKRHKDYMDYQFNLRKRPELQALNDGTPYVLNMQNAKVNGHDTQVSAILRQSPNGCMAVSVFNTEGLNHKFDEYYRPANLTMDCIDLNSDCGLKEMANGRLKAGTEFIDAVTGAKYWVNEHNQIAGGEYYENGQKKYHKINFSDSVLIIYHVPKNVSFTGRKVMYNPQYNFVSNPYTAKDNVIAGSKLALVSR
jgi:hypothetical protein